MPYEQLIMRTQMNKFSMNPRGTNKQEKVPIKHLFGTSLVDRPLPSVS